jgi:hypothetical protein
MKNYILRLFAVCLFCFTAFSGKVNAATTPVLFGTHEIGGSGLKIAVAHPVKPVKAWKQRLMQRIIKWKLHRWQKSNSKGKMTAKEADLFANTSLATGLGTWVCVLLSTITTGGFFFVAALLLGLAAVIFGFVGLSDTTKKGRAIWGIVFGGGFLLIFLFLLVLIAGYWAR